MHDPGDGSAEIVFSNRATTSYEELRSYVGHLRANAAFFDVRIDWDVIKTSQIVSRSAGTRMGLQIADAIAGSFFYAVQPTPHGFVESRYAEMLKPVVYHHGARYRGYGVKFWPRDVEGLLQVDEHLARINEAYK